MFAWLGSLLQLSATQNARTTPRCQIEKGFHSRLHRERTSENWPRLVRIAISTRGSFYPRVRKIHFRKVYSKKQEKRHRYSFPETKSVGKIILHYPRAKLTLPESRLRFLHVARRRPPPPHQMVDAAREGCPWSSPPHVA